MSSKNAVEVLELFGDLEPAEEGYFWFAVRTKPRCEKKLAELAFKHGINYYLPLLESKNQYGNRIVTFHKPMFPGYLFTKCNFEEKRKLMLTGYTAHFIIVKQDKVLTNELKEIHSGKEKGANYRIAKFLKEGSKVELISGPLKGLTGFVENVDNVEEVILKISILRQAVSVSVRTDQVKLISK